MSLTTRYNDNTLMPFGKHKGKALTNVPASYLIYLYEDGLNDGPLKEYIKFNIDVLYKQQKREKYTPKNVLRNNIR